MPHFLTAAGVIRTLAHHRLPKLLGKKRGLGLTGLSSVKRLEGEGVKHRPKRQVLKFKM